MNIHDVQDEYWKRAENHNWQVQERVRAATTDLDHDGMYDLAETVLGRDDEDVVKYREILRMLGVLDEAEDGTSQTLTGLIVRAQLDLAAAVEYALTVHDTFDVKAAVLTLKELAEYSGERIGDSLYHIVEED